MDGALRDDLLQNRISNYFNCSEVLKYYFGKCPYCNGLRYYCPGCIKNVFPELGYSCGEYLACPFDDLTFLKSLGPLEWKLYCNKDSRPDKDLLEDEEIKKLKEEGEALIRRRYELQNHVLREMGMKEYDIEREVEDWREAYC